jgi:uncharacterized membrane protein YkgB
MTGAEPHDEHPHRNEDEPEASPNKLAKAAVILGIVAVLVAILVTAGGFVLGVVAVVLGIAELVNVRRGLATGVGLAVAGIVTGALGGLPFVLHLMGM